MTATSNPQLVESLYKATGSCADHHEPATVRLLHIDTAVDRYIREWAKTGRVLFVTGNPGDGKTHLLRSLEADLKSAKVDLYLDANEEDDLKLIRHINKAAEGRGRAAAVAINEGVLVELLRQAEDQPWAEAARDLLFHPFVYRGGSEERVRPAVCVLDLTLRNNLSNTVVRAALSRMLQLSAPCEGCPGSQCTLQFNAARLADERSVSRLLAALERVSASGFHATMRDVQALLSFLLMGGRGCEEFKRGDVLIPYWQAAFGEGQGPLFDALRRLDPYSASVPFLDDQLWRGSSKTGAWLQAAPPNVPGKDSIQDSLAQFASVKRRALFEHVDGGAILGATASALDRMMAELLQPTRRAASSMVRLLNHFFDRDETQTDLLYLWTTHRYDARAKRYAAASMSVPTQKFEVLGPKLRPEIAEAFPDFKASFSILALKNSPPGDGLRIDRPLVQALLAAELGLPATFRRGEPEARIEAFLDRVAKEEGTTADEVVEVRLVDMDTGVNHRVAVDVAKRAYITT
jgi:hypothetical protein